ncbi:LysR family transcriptional regulator [Hydrogenovibrio sp. SC-1]|uniref:LysR family transcriptional regulator n=1 Tax=Hydrogenovibrio sp. SC-1 TaxID=2065820 RepID=UPI000C7D2E11|nr:LysR family transcriptional regulator [Hydrogenovibrio sp. SC-1]PLA74571.1 LysR family transcriptional regulator [Hydrogenovibrio sp. SC-1]
MGQLEDMQVFVRVVEAGGIGKAAEQLHLAKSAVSRRLADLESRLSTQLINRTTRQSSLTEAGQLYYQQSLDVLDRVTEMNQSLTNGNNDLTGTLRLAVPLSFGLEHLSPLFDRFAKRHPDLTLQLDFSDREVDMVEEGFDLAFRITELKDSSLQARKIAPIQFVLCASPEYLAQYGAPKSLENLHQHKLLQYGVQGASSWRFISPQGESINWSFSSRLIANNGNFLLKMAISGHGIVLLPTFIAWQALAQGQVKPVLLDYKIPMKYACALYPQNRFLSKKARVLIDFLVEQLKDNAYWDQPFE